MCGCFWSKWGHLKKNLEEPRMFFRGFVWKWWGPWHDDKVYWPWLNYNIIFNYFYLSSIVNFKIKKRNIQIVEFLDFQNAWHEVLRNCGTRYLKFWTYSKFWSIIYEIAFSVGLYRTSFLHNGSPKWNQNINSVNRGSSTAES